MSLRTPAMLSLLSFGVGALALVEFGAFLDRLLRRRWDDQ